MKPKRKCCGSKPRCRRCPIRLLAAGNLPPGYAVRKRRLVKVDSALPDVLVTGKGKGKRKGKKKSKADKAAKVTLAA